MTIPVVLSENRTIYSYALLRAFAEENSDSLEAFIPFVLHALSPSSHHSVPQLKSIIQTNDGIEIPQHAMQLILTKLIAKGWAEKKNNASKYKLTNTGQEKGTKSRVQQDITRELNSFVDNLHKFLCEQGAELTKDEVNTLLLTFVTENTETLLDYIIPQGSSPIVMKPLKKSTENYFNTYIQEVLERKPEHYKTLKHLVLGSILSCLIRSSSQDAIQTISTFEGCVLYLDSNYVFSLLELHDKDFSEPAQELFKLIKQYGFKPKILSSTLNEITTVLRAFETEHVNYPPNVPINSIYSVMVRRGFSKSYLTIYIANIESEVRSLGIDVEHVDTKLDRFDPEDIDRTTSIQKYKHEQGRRSRNHDLAAIEFVEKARNRQFYSLTDVPCFFLSSDRSLYQFDRIEAGHEQQGTIGSVMLDRALTGLLWLKNPQTDISLEAIISAHTHHTLINNRIWERFLDVLKSLHKRKKICQNDVDKLVYHGNLDKLLQGFDSEDIDALNDTFVLDRLAAAKEVHKADIEAAEKNASSQTGSLLKAEFDAEMLQLNENHQNQVEKAKADAKAKQKADLTDRITHLSAERAKAWVRFLRVYVVVVALGGGGLSWYTGLTSDMSQFSKSVSGLVGVAMTVSGIGINNVWSSLEKYLTKHFTKMNQKRLNSSN